MKPEPEPLAYMQEVFMAFQFSWFQVDFYVFFYSSRSVFYGSRSVFHGSRSVFMAFHGSRFFSWLQVIFMGFQYSRSVFIVFQGSRLVFHG